MPQPFSGGPDYYWMHRHQSRDNLPPNPFPFRSTQSLRKDLQRCSRASLHCGKATPRNPFTCLTSADVGPSDPLRGGQQLAVREPQRPRATAEMTRFVQVASSPAECSPSLEPLPQDCRLLPSRVFFQPAKEKSEVIPCCYEQNHATNVPFDRAPFGILLTAGLGAQRLDLQSSDASALRRQGKWGTTPWRCRRR